MRQAIEGSLRHLHTDYIDVYIPHFDDGITPIEKTVRRLEDLSKRGRFYKQVWQNFLRGRLLPYLCPQCNVSITWFNEQLSVN